MITYTTLSPPPPPRRPPPPRAPPRVAGPAPLPPPPLPRRHPGHQRQVIVGSPAPAAHIPPPADGTVLHRLRVHLSRRVLPDRGLQQPPRLPLVGRIVAHLEADEFPVAQRQVHPPRLHPLQPGEQVRVERGLQHRAGLRRPRQLRVDHLIVHSARPRLPVRRSQQVRPHQEIRPPEQHLPRTAPSQRPLINDPGPAPQGLRRRPGRVPDILRPADLHDVTPVRPEPLEHPLLVHFPAPDQLLKPDVVLPRRPQLPPRPQQVQLRQPPARQAVRHIASR